MATYGTPAYGPTAEPTQDERIMAALSHGSILVGLGIIVPLIIWYVQRQQSRFVRFQALQAALWQIAQAAVSVVLGGCMFCGIMMTGFASDSSSEPTPLLGAPFCIVCGVLVITFAFIGVGLYAAVVTFTGTDFTYPVIGAWLRQHYE